MLGGRGRWKGCNSHGLRSITFEVFSLPPGAAFRTELCPARIFVSVPHVPPVPHLQLHLLGWEFKEIACTVFNCDRSFGRTWNQASSETCNYRGKGPPCRNSLSGLVPVSRECPRFPLSPEAIVRWRNSRSDFVFVVAVVMESVV